MLLNAWQKGVLPVKGWVHELSEMIHLSNLLAVLIDQDEIWMEDYNVGCCHILWTAVGTRDRKCQSHCTLPVFAPLLMVHTANFFSLQSNSIIIPISRNLAWYGTPWIYDSVPYFSQIGERVDRYNRPTSFAATQLCLWYLVLCINRAVLLLSGILWWINWLELENCVSVSALTRLVRWQEGHAASKSNVCYWHCLHSTHSRVFETAEHQSVCLSLPSFGHYDGFAAVGSVARRSRSIAAQPALGSKCEQCHVVSWRRKLNTDLLITKWSLFEQIEEVHWARLADWFTRKTAVNREVGIVLRLLVGWRQWVCRKHGSSGSVFGDVGLIRSNSRKKIK